MRLWVAQGFGIGRIPVAPGTFGSVLGVLWFAVLLASGRLWLFGLGTLAGLALSVWLCGVGERLLGQKDPGSVVLDEITAMPVCFVSWVAIQLWSQGAWPRVETLFSKANWPVVLGVFIGFRFFDVLKPWPVRQSQALPGGWGITVDDFLAGLYVSLVVLLAHLGRSWLGR